MNKYVFAFCFAVFISCCAQIILKKSSQKKYDSAIKYYLNFNVLIGYSMFIIPTLISVWAFKGIELKNAPILESIGYVYILILSKIFLKEKITKNKLIGNIIIILGIVIFNL